MTLTVHWHAIFNFLQDNKLCHFISDIMMIMDTFLAGDDQPP